MKKLRFLSMGAFLMGSMTFTSAIAGGSTSSISCSDLNGYVASKNVGPTGAYTLTAGSEERASQTYYYSGPGRVSSVRVHGNYPAIIGGVPLRVVIYNVDANGRPTTAIASQNFNFWTTNNFLGYVDVSMPGAGTPVSGNFAVAVEIRPASFLALGQTFQLTYNGDGEGIGEDLASLAGTSTGFNWSSAMSNFSKDGDFYLVPRMEHFINSSFSQSSTCIPANGSVNFNNTSSMTMDVMFNTIAQAGYAGSEVFYAWDFGDGQNSTLANPSHTYATPGVYTVSLTATIDGWNNTCSAVFTSQVSVGLGITATPTAATCNGTATGSISASGNGGAAPYLYSIDGDSWQGTGSFSGLAAGAYTVYIIDALGCEQTVGVNVTQPSAIVANVSSTNAACGSSDGSILVSASGGTGALTYSLDGGAFQSSGTFSNLSSGAYTITVKDANNCTYTTNAGIADNGAPNLTLLSYTNVTCNGGNDGSIVVIGSGGSGTLQYSIDFGTTFQTSGTFSNLQAGVYQILVKDSNGCTQTMQMIISAPNALSITASSEPVSCNGGNDGVITVNTSTGGTGTFQYSLDGIQWQSSTTFNGLAAGTYTVHARDAGACATTVMVTISQPAALSGTTSIVNNVCSYGDDGSVTVNISGGMQPYMYSIGDGGFQYTNVFSGLESGVYAITVMDANGCTFELAANVTAPSEVTATVTAGQTTCGNNNGTILLVGAGGTAPYTYSIDGSNFGASGSFSGLAADIYYGYILDANGCLAVYQVPVTNSNGPALSVLSQGNVSCNGGNDGSIALQGSGGTGTLLYSIDGTTFSTNNMFNGLTAGTYNVYVKDANNCITTTSVVVTEPAAIAVNPVVTNVSCFDGHNGEIVVNAAGGAGALAYSVNGGFTYQSSNTFSNYPAGNYNVIVRDAAGCTTSATVVVSEPTEIHALSSVLNVTCNGDNNGAIYVVSWGGTGARQYSLDGVTYQSSGVFTNLAGGMYTVYVRDINGCYITIDANVYEPAELSVWNMITDVTCAGGDNGVVDIEVSGGTLPYLYIWSNASANEDLFNAPAGTYTVEVIDGNGCSITQSYTVDEPANPIIVNGTVINATSPTGTDGSIDVTVTGGSSPYTFDWSNASTGEDLSGIAPGVYTVEVTDDNNCSASATFTVSFSVGVDEELVANLNLYPNPASNVLNIQAGSATVRSVEVFNMVGQTVYSQQFNTSSAQIDVTSFSTGMYMIRLDIDGKVVTKRFEVTK